MNNLDPKIEEIAEMMIETGKISESSIKRAFSIGYHRTNRVINQLGTLGIISLDERRKPKELLCTTKEELHRLLNK